MQWQQFAAEAPELARLGHERLQGPGIAFIGTLRRDGSPRITPVEPYFVGDELMVGMMWQSRKALDLIRDPRVAVHSATTDKEGVEGDFKLYGRAVLREDPEARLGYADETFARINWRPAEPYHLFAIDVESAGYVIFGDNRFGLAWQAGAPARRFDLAQP